MRNPIARALVEGFILVASHTFAAKTFGVFWERVSPKLTQGVDYLEKHDDEDGLRAEQTLFERVTRRDPEITRIINRCLKDFMRSDLTVLLDTVARIQDRIQERKAQINAWKLATIAAPSSSWMPLKATRKSLERRIQRERAAIDTDLARIEGLKAETLHRLKQAGITMTGEQLDGLLYCAEGSDLARVMAVAENIKAIERELSASLNGPDSGPEQVKTYTGFVMMSYRVYLAAIERACDTIEGVYMSKLGSIIRDAQEQMLRAESLTQHAQGPSQEKNLAIAENNLQWNLKTIELADLYDEHLHKRLQDLTSLAEEMRMQFQLARNTYRTVKVGGELIEVIQAGEKELQSIFDFEPPTLDAFYDKELRRDFDALTTQLKAAARP